MIGGKLPITRLKSRSRSNFKLDRKISIRSRNCNRDHDRDRGDCDQTQPWLAQFPGINDKFIEFNRNVNVKCDFYYYDNEWLLVTMATVSC